MRLTFDNLDGLGAVDYSAAVDRSGPLRIRRSLNVPTIANGMLCLVASTLRTPARRGRVAIRNDAGTLLFTGYLATEPQAVYAGVGTTGPVYRLAFSAISDEWLLDRQGAATDTGPGLAAASGTVVQTLVQRAGGALATGSVASGNLVGVFQPQADATLSANTGALASATYAAYRTLGGVLSLATVGSATHPLSDGDGSLSIATLKTASVRELANDVTVSGELEPGAYVTELFQGDGITSAFALDQFAFVAKAAQKALVNDRFESFNQGVINTATWAASDPGSHLGLSGAGLQMTGGNGFDGQTTLAAIDSVEVGGSLVMELGNVRLSAASDGVLGGFYAGEIARDNCFAGFNVRQSGGQTLLVPIVNGVEIGTSYAALSGHSYTLRLRLHTVEMLRVGQNYYATVDGVVVQFGGGLLAAPASVVMELVDLGASSNTPATILYDGTVAGLVASSPAFCSFVPVNSVQLFGSIGSIRLTQGGSVWVTSTLPSGAVATRLIGIAGQGVDCEVSGAGAGTGTDKITFFAGRVPVAGEKIAVTYRTRQRAIARINDPASVAVEAAGGTSGTARWLGHVMKPEARTSEDCERAALAILSFASARAAGVAGSYDCVNPSDDIWPGDVLALTTNGDTLNVIVRQVTLEDHGAQPEALGYAIGFANDWAEGLGLTLSETIAADALLPATAASAPAMVLANLQGLAVVSATASTLQVDAGIVAPAGGGFEVRRRDSDFGPGVDPDLVLRSPVRSFAIPRLSNEERFFIRMYDGGSPRLYTRFSNEIITHLPVA